jgi:beta-carotene 15,15'-dioxygenase
MVKLQRVKDRMNGSSVFPIQMTVARIRTWRSQPDGEQYSVPRHLLFPVAVLTLLLTNVFSPALVSASATVFATGMILIAGIPHGTLDIEIAAARFGRFDPLEKAAMILGYVLGAGLMAFLWFVSPAAALVSFLAISVVHFGGDWRGRVDPFLAIMIGWAIISTPALSHPEAVTSIFTTLAGKAAGGAIASLLACTAAPALLGSIVFLWSDIGRGAYVRAVNVGCCLIAALALPPLVSFALYFCLLHSPRHLSEAFQEASALSMTKKASVSVAVTCLSFGLGVLLFLGSEPVSLDSGIVLSGFQLLSILTVPHFALEMILNSPSRGAVNQR